MPEGKTRKDSKHDNKQRCENREGMQSRKKLVNVSWRRVESAVSDRAVASCVNSLRWKVETAEQRRKSVGQSPRTLVVS